MAKNNLVKNAKGALAGLYLGDVLGAPVEGLPRESVEKHFGYIKGFVEVPAVLRLDGYTFYRGRKYQGTDDLEFNTILCKTLIARREVSTTIIADMMLDHIHDIRSSPFYGPTTVRKFESLMRGVPAQQAGFPSHPQDGQTCGSATLRSVPIGIINAGNPSRAAREAAAGSLPTHGSKVATAAAGAVAAAVAVAMTGDVSLSQVIEHAIAGAEEGETLGHIGVAPSVSKRIELAATIAKNSRSVDEAANECYDIIGAGIHAAETIPTALGIVAAADKVSIVDAMLAAVNIGGDTDSVACIVGAVLGALRGWEAFPQDMIAPIEETNRISIAELATGLADIALERQKSME